MSNLQAIRGSQLFHGGCFNLVLSTAFFRGCNELSRQVLRFVGDGGGHLLAVSPSAMFAIAHQLLY